MALYIPVTTAGERFVTVSTGLETLTFRTYYARGQSAHWLLDIKDGQGTSLLSGINLVPGVDNLLKGHGDVLEGRQLALLVLGRAGPSPAAREEEYKGLEAPGNTMKLLWLNPGEDNPFAPGDPMDVIGEE